MKNNILKSLIAIAVASAGVTACKKTETVVKTEEGHGIILANMDTTVSPKVDFYNYVNGNWMKTHEIPDDETKWGGFAILRKETTQNVLDILSRAKESGNYGAETDQAKAVVIFDAALDTVARNEQGVTPILPIIEKINKMNSIADFQKLVTEDVVTVSQPFFGLTVFSNPNNSAMNATYLAPAGLGLPDRDFYINTDPESVKIREQYVDHITRMLQFLGDTEESARKQANVILKFETKLAEPRLDKVQSRDFRNFNNPRSVADLQKMVPQIQWEQAFRDMKIKEQIDTLIVMQPKYMETVKNIFAKPDFETWRTVMKWATLNNSADLLSTEIERANWEFYAKTLNGAQKQKPANERALEKVNATVGEAIGKLYVDEMFPPEAKEKAQAMIKNVIAAFKDRIHNLDWMSDSTKVKAIEKLDKFTVKIGYPDKWKDYSTMDVKEGKSYYDNMVAVAEWNLQDDFKKINQPVDRSEWGMNAHTVNAYFNPLNNEIVFPAAILQPPFYDYKADEAVNYGGMGAVIGHEISHAFDDSGARFDANGNLVNWWTDQDLANFTARGKALADQYSAVEVLPGVFINGEFTLGENIGDLGGILGAYDGLQRFFKENGRPDNIDGFTPEQRFFMSWATVWRVKSREEALRNQIKTDPHSPEHVRATQPLLNVDAFYEAFDIKEGDPMYLAPEKRVRIW
ncbi:MAG TPA: M13 family metallopeptidase [Flavobacteriaceae bacterium]|nr:M13 family metallopeptidase [Flavobacteriaceae bacterium]